MRPNSITRFGILIGLMIATGLAFAGGPGISRQAAPMEPEASTEWPFLRAKVGPPNSMRFRDLEFWWDQLFVTARGEVGVSDSIRSTLDSLGARIADNKGWNPQGISLTDIALAYNYFNPGSDPYDDFVGSPTGFTMGYESAGADTGGGHPAVAAAPLPDRGHVDFYLYAASNPAHSNYNYGTYPSKYLTAKEDSVTGSTVHWFARPGLPDSFIVFHNNSIMAGPVTTADPLVDLAGTGWTKDGMVAIWEFAHEFQHGLYAKPERAQNRAGVPLAYPVMTELLSSASEGLAGNNDRDADFECPSTWSIFQEGPVRTIKANGVDTTVSQQNYQARRALGEYLTYGFRGANRSTAPAAIQDDLLYRWAHGWTGLDGLTELLADSTCSDCATYFGAGTDRATRFTLLLHDFHIANFVNNPSLAQGQYGYPAVANFTPSIDNRAWQSFNGDPCDDSVSVAPELTASRRWTQVDTTIVGLRAGTTPSCRPTRMTVPMFGAQYWVIRSDTALAHGSQDLRIRVSAVDILNAQIYGDSTYDGRLVATVVPYTEQSAAGTPEALWAHPEWAGTPLATQWVDIDSVSSALEFTVPAFGATNKAALLVVTLTDGPRRTFSYMQRIQGLNGDHAADDARVGPRRYRLSLSVRESGTDTSDVRMVARGANQIDDHPTWAPSGGAIAFESTNPAITSLQQIYTVATSGGTPTRLHAQAFKQSAPDWSPRGDWVAFEAESVSYSGVWVRSASTSEARRLTSLDCEHRTPTFRADGQRIAYFEYGRVVGNQIMEAWQLRSVGVDGTGDAAITPYMSQARPQSLRWSADGATLYFTRNDSIFAVSSGGGTPTNVTSLVRHTPSFDLHPFGWRTAFEDTGARSEPRYGWDELTETEIFDNLTIPHHRISVHDPARFVLQGVTRSDDEPRFYRTSAEFFNPRWSPDGLRIAYSSDQNAPGDRDLFVGRVSYDHAPTFTAVPGDGDIPAGVPYVRVLRSQDADGQAPDYVVHFLPSGASLVDSTFSWPNPTVGVHYVVFRVHDGTGGVQSKVVRFNVVDSGSGGCPFVDTKTAVGWQTENSILARALDAVPRLDAYRLKYTPQAKAGRVTLRLRENEQEYTALDQVRLVAVDHDPAVRAFADGEKVWLGGRTPAAKVVDQHGNDVTAQLSGLAEPYQGRPGDTLYVSMTGGKPAGATGAQQVLEGGGGIIDDGDKGGEGGGGGGGGGNRAVPATAEQAMEAHDLAVLEGSGILIQTPDGEGGWRTVEHRYPRESFDEHVLDSLGTGELRLVFLGKHRVRFIGRLTGAEAVTPVVLPLRAASHSRLGDVQAAVTAAAGAATALTPGDTLTLQYDWPEVAAGKVRDAFLLGLGTYSSSKAALRALPPDDAAAALPVAYALGQNQPNPFQGTTTIHFALPQASEVRLEVFDLQGRRVATVAQGRWAAGYHAVEWGQQASNGRRVEAGVYLYRLTAGTFRAQKKMVLLP